MTKIDTGLTSFTNYSQIEKNSTKSIYTYNCGYYTIHNKATNFTEATDPSGYLLIYLHKGTMQVLINGQSIKVSDGHVLIYQPKQERRIIYDKNEENTRYFVYFQGPEVPRFLEQLSLSNQIIYKTGSIPAVINNFNAIIDDYKINDVTHDINRLIQLLSILQTISNAAHESTKKAILTDDIANVIEIMKSSYYKNYNLKYYADKCNMSVPTFLRHFKAQTGTTPVKYINDFKIDIAKSFLATTNLSILEISFNLGIRRQLYFCNFFKKYTGLNPTQYRELHNKNIK